VKILSFLNELEATTGTAKSLYISSGLPLPEVENLLERMLDPQAIPPELAKLTADSKTGAVIFWNPARTLLVLPPFPIVTEYFTQDYFVEPLCSLLERDFRIALILVRLGAYAIGLCEGESLIASKVGTGLIHGRHKQGGSSQHISGFEPTLCGDAGLTDLIASRKPCHNMIELPVAVAAVSGYAPMLVSGGS